MLKPLSAQAARLQEFFAGCTGSVDIADFPSFAKLQENQNAIRTGILGTTTITPADYLDIVANNDDVIDTLFPAGSEARTLWDRYKAGHYLITRDWRLVGTLELTPENITIVNDIMDVCDPAMINAFTAAAAKTDYSIDRPIDGGYQYPYSDGRGFGMPGFGQYPEAALEQIEIQLVDRGADLLITNGGVPASAREQAKAMVKALVVQFGQDTEEFRAIIHDLQTNPTKFAGALGPSYSQYELKPAPISPDAEVSIAPIGQQSSVRLTRAKGTHQTT